MYANKFCDAGQVPIFRYFEAWDRTSKVYYFFQQNKYYLESADKIKKIF